VAKEDIASYTLESWFKFAEKFWEFTDGYSGLTEYSTLKRGRRISFSLSSLRN
jgi:hypothetical protein